MTWASGREKKNTGHQVWLHHVLRNRSMLQTPNVFKTWIRTNPLAFLICQLQHWQLRVRTNTNASLLLKTLFDILPPRSNCKAASFPKHHSELFGIYSCRFLYLVLKVCLVWKLHATSIKDPAHSRSAFLLLCASSKGDRLSLWILMWISTALSAYTQNRKTWQWNGYANLYLYLYLEKNFNVAS